MANAVQFLLCSFIILCFSTSASSCTESSDCKQFEVCRSDSQCDTRSLWSDYRWQDALGFSFIFIGAFLAAGGGIGGGGVFIPLLTLVVGMTSKQAIPISQATIFGGSLVNLAFNIREKHPNRSDGPLIDYSVVMMFTPMLLAGTTIGVVLNVILPSWLITLLLVIIMSYVSRRTLNKAILAWHQENEAERERELSSASPLEPMQHLSRFNSESEPEFEPESFQYDVAMIVTTWVFVVGFSILKGSKSGGSSVVGIRSCSIFYWLLNLGLLSSLTLLTLVLGRHLQKRTSPKYSLRHDNVVEIHWDGRSTIFYPCLSVLAGIVGGLLGIGGGMVLAPLLLEIGIHSRVVSATSATAVLITSSSAMVQYLLLDLLIPSYFVFYFVVGAIATAVGQVTFDYLVRKYKRTSVLSLSIAMMIIIATVLLFISGVLETIADFKNRRLGFSSPC